MIAFRSAAYICALCLGTNQAWAINKCTDKDGRLSYQETPCDPAAKHSEALKIQESPPTTPFEAKASAAIARGRIMVGMTASQVRRSWGSPSKVNRSVGSYGTHEQWVYDRGIAKSQYVYLENGVVSSIQSPD